MITAKIRYLDIPPYFGRGISTDVEINMYKICIKYRELNASIKHYTLILRSFMNNLTEQDFRNSVHDQ